jgi:hypothetical protein
MPVTNERGVDAADELTHMRTQRRAFAEVFYVLHLAVATGTGLLVSLLRV